MKKKILLTTLLIICIIFMNINYIYGIDKYGEFNYVDENGEYGQYEGELAPNLIDSAWEQKYQYWTAEQWNEYFNELIDNAYENGNSTYYYESNEITDEEYLKFYVANYHIAEIANKLANSDLNENGYNSDELAVYYQSVVDEVETGVDSNENSGFTDIIEMRLQYDEGWQIIQEISSASGNEKDIYESFTREQWGKALMYIKEHQTDYVATNGRVGTVTDEENRVVEILRNAAEQGADINLNFTSEEIANINAYNSIWRTEYNIEDVNISGILEAIDVSEPFVDFEEQQHTYVEPEQDPVEGVTLGDIIKGANNFLSLGGQNGDRISDQNLKTLSNNLYNILFGVGILIAFIIGGILGIKFMTEGVEGKAEVKNMLVPYIVGCVVLFGSFTIWKIVVTILQA